MTQQSRQFSVRASGPLACFTRPEMKVERVSYEVMTPSAARGVLEAILWKPAIRWEVEEIVVLAPVRWASFRRNEVGSRASPQVEHRFIEGDRVQRNTVALRDVDYVIRAAFRMTDRAGADDSVRKFEEMFERRLEKGQRFHQPYLGCREFAARVEPFSGNPRPADAAVHRPLGLMLYDLDYDRPDGKTQPLFFEARLEAGGLRVPPWDEVRRQNGGDR